MKKGYVIILLFMITFATFVGYKTYSYYSARFNVTAEGTGGVMVCDFEIDEPYVYEKDEYGYSEFKIQIKDSDDSGKYSDVIINYTLTIENREGSNGLFSEDGNNFSSKLVLNGEYNDTERIIKVKTADGSSSNIDYKIDLKCVQSQM